MDVAAAERLLNLPDVYTAEDVNLAWRDAIARMHPDVRVGVDKDTANAEAVRINTARSVLITRFNKGGNKSYRRSPSAKPNQKPSPHEKPPQRDRPKPSPKPSNDPGSKRHAPSPADREQQSRTESSRPATKNSPEKTKTNSRDAAKPAFCHYGWENFKNDATSFVYETGLLSFETYKQIISAFVKLVLADDDYPEPFDVKAHRIKRFTGRIAVLVYLLPLFICMRICATSSDPSLSSYGMMMGARVLFAGIFNMFIPVITGLLRHFPLKRLRTQMQSDNT